MPLFGGQTLVNRWGSYGRRQTVSGSQSSQPPSPQEEDLVLEVADSDENAMSPEDEEQRDMYLRAISRFGEQ